MASAMMVPGWRKERPPARLVERGCDALAEVIRREAFDRDSFDAGAFALRDGDGAAGQPQPRREQGDERCVGGAIYRGGAETDAEHPIFDGERVAAGARGHTNGDHQSAMCDAERQCSHWRCVDVSGWPGFARKWLHHVRGSELNSKPSSTISAHQEKMSVIVARRSSMLMLMRGNTR